MHRNDNNMHIFISS